MNNVGDDDVIVIETQTGKCRELDNVRLADFGNANSKARPTYPITTEVEYNSVILYREIQAEIIAKPSYQRELKKLEN